MSQYAFDLAPGPAKPRHQELKLLLSHEAVEWYTPPLYTDLARLVMGEIDLDPASSPLPNQWVKAKQIFTQADNGLRWRWHGRVWLNPPYSKTAGKSNQEIWANKLISEYQAGRVTEAILLTKASLGYKWFDDLFIAYPVCLAYGLISFINGADPGAPPKPAKLGSAFFYFGPNYDRFKEVFNQIGKVIPV